jgi:hypothetical protein
MQKYLILLASVLVVVAVMYGCEDRGSGMISTDLGELQNYPGVDPSPSHVFDPALYLQLRNSTQQLLGSAYVPPEAIDGEPVPLLVLLAPETGNRFYYFKAGLSELVRELTASGQIKPMVIYCMANDQTLGGFFYSNSTPAGFYDSIFNSDGVDWTAGGRDDLLEYLHKFYPATIQQASKRGIGGIGQGAYGAFRAIIKNPGLYSSISVADGPLDFDGGSGGGLTGLFDDALAEEENFYYTTYPFVDTLKDTTFVSGTPYDVIWVDTIDASTFDTTWVNFDTVPFSYHRDFDTSYTIPLSMMLIGGSFAFSPNDTRIDYTRNSSANPPTSFTQYQIYDGTAADSLDYTTFIGGIVKKDFNSHYIDMDFQLPFDSNGNLYAPIWNNYWMPNNLENLYNAQGGRPLDGVKMFFATNPNARWNYYQMTQSWISFLKEDYADTCFQIYPYSNYASDDPVVSDEYLFDVLRQMLIFHSNNFNK